MKKIGQKISASRKKKKLRLADVSEKVGISISHLSAIENDQLKGEPDPDIVIGIAEALGDDSILMHYLENNPVYRAILPKVFPDLNNIRRDPAIIFGRLANEAAEAREAALIMAEVFQNADPRRTPKFDETFSAAMEQILDIKRAVEILEFELLASGEISKQWLSGVYEQQQKKCEDRGHHEPARH